VQATSLRTAARRIARVELTDWKQIDERFSGEKGQALALEDRGIRQSEWPAKGHQKSIFSSLCRRPKRVMGSARLYLDQVAKRDPSRYLGVCASLIPKDVSLSIEQRLPGGLSQQDLAIFSAIKSSIPDANTRDPAEVLNYVLEAIRSHAATKIIEG